MTLKTYFLDLTILNFNYYFKGTIDLGEFAASGVEGTLKCWDINADFHWNVFRNKIF